MLRTTVLLLVSLCGLQTRSPAQLHFGIELGGRVSATAHVGPVELRLGSPRRVAFAPRFGPRHGHAHRVARRVWVPGCFEVVHVPARFRTRYDACGNPVRVLVRPAHTKRVWRAGHWSYARRTVRWRR